MPANLHFGFCLFATLVFVLIFLRRKTVSSIIWLLICDATAILQFFNDSKTATAVGICEIVLFAILAYVSFGEWREHRRIAAEKAAEEAEKVENDEEEADEAPDPYDLSDIEKIIKNERSKLAGNSQNDIIGNAFEEN